MQSLTRKILLRGCEYINSQTFEPIDNQVTFYNQMLQDQLQNNMPEFKKNMIEAFKKFPSVWHYSWHNLVRRMNVDLEFWDAQWSRLNGSDVPPNRFFPNTKREDITPELIKARAEFLKDKTLEEKPMELINIDWLDTPEIIKDWLNKG